MRLDAFVWWRRGYRRRLGLAVPVMATGALAFTGWALCSRVSRVEVQGDSMRPALQPGDRLVAVRGLPASPGAVVVVLDPRDHRRTMIKRVDGVKRVEARTPVRLTLAGDHPSASTDSRHFGTVERALVRGRVVWRYAPEGRRGRVPSRRMKRQLVLNRGRRRPTSTVCP